jgi:hypothetical protein
MLHCAQQSLELASNVEREARKGITVHYRSEVNIGTVVLERRRD